jgi:hypothetical protein
MFQKILNILNIWKTIKFRRITLPQVNAMWHFYHNLFWTGSSCLGPTARDLGTWFKLWLPMDSRFVPSSSKSWAFRICPVGQINSFEAACIDLPLQKQSQTRDWVFDVAELSSLPDSVEKTTQYFTPSEFHTAWIRVQIMTIQSPVM